MKNFKITQEIKEAAEEQIKKLQKEINFDTKDYPIEVLVDKFRTGDFYIPEYQRKFIWNKEQQIRFIESVLLGLPIPFMFFSDNDDGRCEIIDGAQRTQTLEAFLNNDLILNKLEKLTNLDGFSFDDLPEMFKRKFKGRTLRIIVLADTTAIQIRQDIFNRINTGGKKAIPSEIRRGTHTGNFMKFVEECAKDEQFTKLCPISETMRKRYEDSELIVRFFAYLNNYQNFKHNVDTFLDRFVQDKDKEFDEKAYKEEFKNMLDFVKKHFLYGFAKTKNAKSTPRVRFEAISVGVALALRQKPKLVPASMKWLESDQFKIHTTTHASNSTKRVVGRIEYVRDMLLKGDADENND